MSLSVVASFAQPTPGQCDFTPVTIAVETCLSNPFCGTYTGCPTTNFTVPCDSCFCIDLDWDCPNDDCRKCQGCAWVFQGATYLTSVHHQDCANNDCHVSSCDQGGQVLLKTGLAYTLYACFTNCDNEDCTICNQACKLRATLRYHDASCN